MVPNNKTVRIFMMPQNFPCGPQSSCCGPVGQSEEEIENFKSNIQGGLGCEVEVFDVTNHDAIRSNEQVVQILTSYGPKALPVITLGDDVVSIGNPAIDAPNALVEAIREKANQI